MLQAFLTYATVAYLSTLIITLVRLAHFFYKFRVANHREVAAVLVIFLAPHLLFSLLTFPLEIFSLIKNRTIIEPKLTYEVACAAFNMKRDQLYWGYRVRHYERKDLEDC